MKVSSERIRTAAFDVATNRIRRYWAEERRKQEEEDRLKEQSRLTEIAARIRQVNKRHFWTAERITLYLNQHSCTWKEGRRFTEAIVLAILRGEETAD